MRYIIIIILAISILSCENKAQSLNIPDKIEIKNLNKKINVKGTKVLIDSSDNYTFYDDIKRFQKDSKNYFQIIELTNQDYNKSIPKTINKINELENQGGKLRVKKEIKLGIYNAYFALAPQGTESEQIIFAFGDETFSVLIMGVFQNNEKERKEITDLILSTYYDKKINVNNEDSISHSVDLENSDFKLLFSTTNLANYTLNGEELTEEGIYTNNFVIATLPNNIKDFNLKSYSDNLIYKLENNIYKEKNIKIENRKEDTFKEGIDEIIKVEIDGIFKNKKMKIFQYIKQTPKGIILFIGTDISMNYIYLNEYKEIAQRIKLK